MRNILRGLFNGNIIPWERKDPHNERQHKIIRMLEEEERYFMEKMSLDDCQRFQALSQLHSELLSQEEENIFSYGFTLGMLMMLDVMDEARLITD